LWGVSVRVMKQQVKNIEKWRLVPKVAHFNCYISLRRRCFWTKGGENWFVLMFIENMWRAYSWWGSHCEEMVCASTIKWSNLWYAYSRGTTFRETLLLIGELLT
jgi:hypothetical protein